MEKDGGVSNVHGTLLMVGVLVILVIIIMAIFTVFFPVYTFHNSLAPEHIRIVGVNHAGAKLESQVVIRSFIEQEIDNDTLMALLKVNGKEILARIYTLHGTDFIPTHHFGVKTIGGSGCRGQFFSHKETIVIDLKNGYIRPGDLVEMNIYQKSSDTSLPPIQGDLTDEAYMYEYTSEFIFREKGRYRIFSQHRYTA